MNTTKQDLIDAVFDNIEQMIYKITPNNIKETQTAIFESIKMIEPLMDKYEEVEKVIKKEESVSNGMPNFTCNVKIKKTAYVKVEDVKYNCECGQELLQNDKYCPYCHRKIDSEEWEWIIRDKAEFEEIR